MRRATIACSSRSLTLPQQLLAEVVVHGRVGAAAGGAGERHRLGAGAVAAHQQLGARADEGELGGADAPAEAGREGVAQRPEHGGGVVRRGRVCAHLARQHDLLELARRRCARRRARPPARSARAARRWRPWSRWTGIGIDQRHRGRARARRRGASTRSVRRAATRHRRQPGTPSCAPRRGGGPARPRGAPARPGASEDHSGVRAAVLGEGEAPDEHGPGGAGRSGVAGRRRRRARVPRSRARTATSRKRPGAARLERDRAAQPGEHEAVAVGLLEAEEAVVGALRAQDGRREVELGRERDRDRRERRSPVPRARFDGLLAPAARAALAPRRSARTGSGRALP